MALYRLNVEIGYDGRYTIARPAALPGCFSKALSKEEAVQAAPAAIEKFYSWLRSWGEEPEVPKDGITMEIAEEFTCSSDGSYEIGAYFATDGEPVYPAEIREFLRWMDFSRQDLLGLVYELPLEALDERPAEDRRTLREILEHVAGAEVWYLTRLDAPGTPSGRSVTSFPLEAFTRLRSTREYAVERLSLLTQIERSRPTFHRGEQWSARKIFRRFLEHENEHRMEIVARIGKV